LTRRIGRQHLKIECCGPAVLAALNPSRGFRIWIRTAGHISTHSAPGYHEPIALAVPGCICHIGLHGWRNVRRGDLFRIVWLHAASICRAPHSARHGNAHRSAPNNGFHGDRLGGPYRGPWKKLPVLCCPAPRATGLYVFCWRWPKPVRESQTIPGTAEIPTPWQQVSEASFFYLQKFPAIFLKIIGGDYSTGRAGNLLSEGQNMPESTGGKEITKKQQLPGHRKGAGQ
jgi:hypothetical protein